MEIPRQSAQSVFTSGTTPAQSINASASSFGGLEAQALSGAAAQLDRAADVASTHVLAQQGLQNEAQAKDADIAITKRLTELQYNPKTGYLTSQGKNAVDGFEKAMTSAEDIRNETLDSITNPAVRRMVDQVAARRVQSAIEGMSRHAAVENRRWQLETSDARALTTLDAAALNYVDDKTFRQAMATAKDEAVQQGEMQGWSPEVIKLREQQYTDRAWVKRLDAWQLHDPVGALDAFMQNQDAISAERRPGMQRQLFQAADAVLATGVRTGVLKTVVPGEDDAKAVVTAATKLGLKFEVAIGTDPKEMKTVFDRLPTDQKLHVLQLAQAQTMQDRQEYKAAVNNRMQDSIASYLVNGRAQNPPSQGELVTAYGPEEGNQRWRRLDEIRQTGDRLQEVKMLPQSELEAMRTAAKPADGEGFAERQRNYEILTHAIDSVQKQRQDDPVLYALSTKSYGIEPIKDFSNLGNLQGQLTMRARSMEQMSTDYGVKPALLTKPEAQALAGIIRTAPIPLQKQYLATIYTGLNDMNTFKLAMQSLAPDAPVIAQAGIMQARRAQAPATDARASTDVADLILRGQAILYPPSKEDGGKHEGGRSLIKMPEDKLLADEFQNQVGDAFKDKEKARDLFMQTARAIYATRSAEEGDYSGIIDKKRWDSSIDMATGGIIKYKGTKIIAPYGMPPDKFNDGLRDRVQALAPMALRATADELMQLPLENVGDGRYQFLRGTGYIVDQNGRPLVVDFNVPPGQPPAPEPKPAPARTAKGKLDVPEMAVTKGGAVTGRTRNK